MPISKECLKSLRNFIDDYEVMGKSVDQNYKTLFEGLKNLLNEVTEHARMYKDEVVTGCLASTALKYASKDPGKPSSNPQFIASCQKFQDGYQDTTRLLNSFFDESFQLQPGPIWSREEKTVPSRTRTAPPAAFLLDLQLAIRARER